MTKITESAWNDNGQIQPPRPLLLTDALPNPYPIEALPITMRDAALAISEHVMAPTALAGQCVLGACAHIAQSRVNAFSMNNPGGMPVSLMLLTLGLSGDRKTACRNLAFQEIDKAERAARNHHKGEVQRIHAQGVALTGNAREQFFSANPIPADPVTQYSDATFERIAGDFIRGKGYATWDTDEASQMLAGSSIKAETRSATIGGLCKLFDDGKVERSRSLSNSDGSGVAYHRRMCMHLMGQPIAVAAALADPLLRGQGFLPRFLFSAPSSLAGSRMLTRDALKRNSHSDPRLMAFWERCCEMMASPDCVNDFGEVIPPILPLEHAAEGVWINAYNEIEKGQAPLGKYADIQAFAARFGELAIRVATIFAFVDKCSVVTRDHMVRACKLAQYSLDEWLRYSEQQMIRPALKAAADAMEWLRAPRRAQDWKEFHVDAWGKAGPPALRSAKKRNEILRILIEHGQLLTCDHKTFRINPAADSEETEE